MEPLQFSFNKPPFDVKDVVVCPFENRRGRLTGYNLVAQGGLPCQQAILGNFSNDVGREFVSQQVATLKAELNIAG